MTKKKSTKSRKKKAQVKKRTTASQHKVKTAKKAKGKAVSAPLKKSTAKTLKALPPSTSKSQKAPFKKAGKTAAGAALKSLYSSGGAKPNLEFEKQFESELESFDEKKHSVPGGSKQPFEEEEEEVSPEPPRDEELFDYDDEDLEY